MKSVKPSTLDTSPWLSHPENGPTLTRVAFWLRKCLWWEPKEAKFKYINKLIINMLRLIVCQEPICPLSTKHWILWVFATCSLWSAVGKVGWRINNEVLDVQMKIWNSPEAGLAGFPSKVDKPLPEKVYWLIIRFTCKGGVWELWTIYAWSEEDHSREQWYVQYAMWYYVQNGFGQWIQRWCIWIYWGNWWYRSFIILIHWTSVAVFTQFLPIWTILEVIFVEDCWISKRRNL